jgi:hypothetical protein
MRIALLCLALLAPLESQAKKFANQFVEFELPDKWDCQLDGTEWVCQSSDEQKKRDAIIVLAAKIRKPGMDELAVYKAHLEKAQQFQSLSGEPITSEPKYAKDLDIQGHPWVDALHLQSEIPDFYTRYLGTIKEDLGILITFSVRKDKYEEYGPYLETMVKSLRAFRLPGDPFPASTSTDTNVVAGPYPQNPPRHPASSEGGDGLLGVLVLFLAGGGGGFFWWKKKQKR